VHEHETSSTCTTAKDEHEPEAIIQPLPADPPRYNRATLWRSAV
jgi:hypothetical protein